VVGLSPKPIRPSHSVARYLRGAGYRIVPINPGHDEILGEKSYATLEAAARDRGVAMSTLALAWVLAQPNITAAVIGPRRREHLDEAIAACEIGLTTEEAAQLADGFHST